MNPAADQDSLRFLRDPSSATTPYGSQTRLNFTLPSPKGRVKRAFRHKRVDLSQRVSAGFSRQAVLPGF